MLLWVAMKTCRPSAPASVLFIDDQSKADRIHARADVVKLFYQKHARYGCRSQTWGGSKGEDHYDEVCVALNDTTLRAYSSR